MEKTALQQLIKELETQAQMSPIGSRERLVYKFARDMAKRYIPTERKQIEDAAKALVGKGPIFNAHEAAVKYFTQTYGE